MADRWGKQHGQSGWKLGEYVYKLMRNDMTYAVARRELHLTLNELKSLVIDYQRKRGQRSVVGVRSCRRKREEVKKKEEEKKDEKKKKIKEPLSKKSKKGNSNDEVEEDGDDGDEDDVNDIDDVLMLSESENDFSTKAFIDDRAKQTEEFVREYLCLDEESRACVEGLNLLLVKPTKVSYL
jgi:hypothetical protein